MTTPHTLMEHYQTLFEGQLRRYSELEELSAKQQMTNLSHKADTTYIDAIRLKQMSIERSASYLRELDKQIVTEGKNTVDAELTVNKNLQIQ